MHFIFSLFHISPGLGSRLNALLCLNKLKSLKVNQVKDEMDGDEDDGYYGVCDVVLCGDVMCDGVSGGEGSAKVK